MASAKHPFTFGQQRLDFFSSTLMMGGHGQNELRSCDNHVVLPLL